ncbi:MAG: hypothetical protein IPM96_13260 [Ignavibacteria bacterium]|nr:hypothetical protein [Ignavibacteria bacterium]
MGIEGFWHGATQVQDTVKIYLANSSPPYNSLDLANIYLNSTGNASANFNSASSGNYYIRVTHRNALETWSTSAVSFTGGSVTNYSFITAQAQAFGNNQLMNLGRWCFFCGDANQDGVIDLSDGSDVDNDAFNFVSGYVNTDVNGDGVVDLTDAAYVDNNAFNFVGVIKP